MNKQKKYREINKFLVITIYPNGLDTNHIKKPKNNHLSFFTEQAKNNIAKNINK